MVKQKTYLSRMVLSRTCVLPNKVQFAFFSNVCFISNFFIMFSIPSLSLQVIILLFLTCSTVPNFGNGTAAGDPVSYTHLTLPTN